MKRVQDASCAICMDSLFDLRDDLDEVLDVATPDCGHVFHEKCLLEWFKSQADAYLANAREYRGEEDLTVADAPAECPQCRAECFADPETGEPALHRLFINWGEDVPSSQAVPGSSPPRPTPTQKTWRRPAEKELLNLARRARNLGAEVGSYNAESGEDDVAGALRRAESLKVEAAETKAAKGFKAYIGGLTRALNELNVRLESHPLVSTLQARLAASEARVREKELQLEEVHRVEIPRLLVDTNVKVVAKMDRAIARAVGQRDLIQRELEKSQVALKEQRKAAVERELALEAKLEQERRKLELERGDRAEMGQRLDERNKQVHMLRARVERRKELKTRVEELEAENRALRAKVGGGEAPAPRKEVEEEPMEEMSMPRDSPAPEPTAEESLLIDMPPPQSSSPPLARRSVTARTFTYGPTGRDRIAKSTKSKYFPSPRGNTLVPASSPLGAASPPPRRFISGFDHVQQSPLKPSRSIGNAGKRPPQEPDIIDLLDSSPPPVKRVKAPAPTQGGIFGLLADRNGKPRKNIATGPKYRRRA